MQIEDLTKELKRKQDECDSLRHTIIGFRNKHSVINFKYNDEFKIKTYV